MLKECDVEENTESEREIREWPLLMRNTGLNWCWRSRAEIALSDPKRISGRDVWEVTSGLQISNPAQRVQNHYIKPGLAKQTTKDEILLPLRRSGDRWLANECCFCDLLMQSKMRLSTSLHKTFIFRWKPVNIPSKYFNVLLHNLLNFLYHCSSLQYHMIIQISFWFAGQETFNINIRKLLCYLKHVLCLQHYKYIYCRFDASFLNKSMNLFK